MICPIRPIRTCLLLGLLGLLPAAGCSDTRLGKHGAASIIHAHAKLFQARVIYVREGGGSGGARDGPRDVTQTSGYPACVHLLTIVFDEPLFIAARDGGGLRAGRMLPINHPNATRSLMGALAGFSLSGRSSPSPRCAEGTWRFVDVGNQRLHSIGGTNHDRTNASGSYMDNILDYIRVDDWDNSLRYLGNNAIRLLHMSLPSSSAGCGAEPLQCNFHVSPPPSQMSDSTDNTSHGRYGLQTFHGVPVQASLDLGLVYGQELRQKPEEIIIYKVSLKNDSETKSSQNYTDGDASGHSEHFCALVERPSGGNQSDSSTATSLVDLGTRSRVAIMAQVFKGLVTDVVDGVVGGAATPMLEQTEERAGEADTDDMTGKLETSIDASAPVSISQMLEASLTYNLTGLLTDSVTAALSPRISSNLLDTVGSVVARVVVDEVPPRASHRITKLLVPTLTQRMGQALPNLLTRVLGPRLTDTLTRSVTHALVPALSRSLTHTAHQRYWCEACYRYKRYCNYCHESPQSAYYNSYYSSYYSDFFSDYYGTYYSDAFREVDKLQHPVGKDSKNPRCGGGAGRPICRRGVPAER